MNLLVTGAFDWQRQELDKLSQMGHSVVFMQYEADALPCKAEWVEGVIANGLFLTHPIERFVNLKYIQLTSAGFDRVNTDYVKAHNIEIHNAKGVYSVPMAELSVCGVLQLYKQSKFFLNNQKEHKWEKHRNLFELFGKTVCVVGCGSVGNECAKRFAAFGCEVIGVDLTPYDNSLYKEMLSVDKIDAALNKSDITVLTLPLNSETQGLFNKQRFDAMKEKSVLVNVSRGGVVDSKALVEALNGKLYGAVLDVFETEPLDDNSPLWDMENVIITPHNSFVGEGNHSRMLEVIFSNLTKE